MSLKSTNIRKVILQRRAYEDMVIYASRYASDFIDKENQREVYGILVGKIDEKRRIVYVNQAIGIAVGSRTGVEFENKQYVDLSNIDSDIWQRSVEYARGDFICGWWHTHPGFGFFYSQTDTINHLGFQTANPFAIGIIYDYTQRKSQYEDAGIEVITLSNIEHGQMSDYETVNFQIKDKLHALDYLDHTLTEKMRELDNVKNSITYINNTLQKRDLAQIQRNFGLLLIEKNQKKNPNNLDHLNAEERWLYEWNEQDIKKKYEIPRFRKKIEKKILNLRKHKENRGKGQLELENMLQNPLMKITTLYNTFKQELVKIKPYRRWLDANERLILSYFNQRVSQYIQILNALISKTYHILPNIKSLETQLFDETLLDKVFYGDETQIGSDEVSMPELSSNPLYSESDGSFQNLEADPELFSNSSSENFVDLIVEAVTSGHPKSKEDKISSPLKTSPSPSIQIKIQSTSPIRIKPVTIDNTEDHYQLELDEVFESDDVEND